MKSKIVMFFVAYLAWCLLNWVPDWQHLVTGIFIAALVAVITSDLFVVKASTSRHPLRYFYFFVYYVPVFLWECLKANIDVAYRVLSPTLPIRPAIVKIKTTLKTDTALTFLANSITLTPGTMSVDIDRDNGILYIHWINARTTDTEAATKMIAGRFERILKKIFE